MYGQCCCSELKCVCVEEAGSRRDVVTKKVTKALIHGTYHKWRGHSQSEYKLKPSEWNYEYAGEVLLDM